MIPSLFFKPEGNPGDGGEPGGRKGPLDGGAGDSGGGPGENPFKGGGNTEPEGATDTSGKGGDVFVSELG